MERCTINLVRETHYLEAIYLTRILANLDDRIKNADQWVVYRSLPK